MLLDNNFLGVLVCTVYIFGIIGVAELLRRWRGYSSNFTRKIIHIGVGMMSWGLIYLFTSPWPFIIVCLLFAVLLYLDYKFVFFPAMASADKSNKGTIYFPLAAAAVVYVFWTQPPLMVAALMPLTWGDGLAPVVGRAYGRRAYFVASHMRTVEGSMGFFVFGFLFTWLALWVMPGPPTITMATALLPALVITLCTTVVEAVSVWGIDNLTITAVAILILQFWPFI
jgi:phytol kinase